MKDAYDKLEAFDLAQPAGTSDAARLAAYAAPTVAQYSDVPIPKWAGYFAQFGFLSAMSAYASEGGLTPPAGASASSQHMASLVLLMVSNPGTFPIVMMSNAQVLAEVTAGLTAFVAEGAAGRLVSPLTNSAFTQTDMNNLMAMGTSMVSQAALDGWSGVPNLDDLAAARNPTRGAGG